MRKFFLAVAAMSGFLPVAWVLGLCHVFDVYEQDYYVAYLYGEELREPIPGVFRLLYEHVPGPYAALAVAVSLIALLLARAVSLRPELFAGVTDLLAEAVGSRPRPMGIRGRNSLQARIRRWMRTHRRTTYFQSQAARPYREMLPDPDEDEPSSRPCYLFLAKPVRGGYIRREME